MSCGYKDPSSDCYSLKDGKKESQRTKGLTWEVYWEWRKKRQGGGQRLVPEDKSGRRERQEVDKAHLS